MRITLAQGDITRQAADVIVNAANSSLLGGGGVDGAIHRRGGPAILAECRQLRAGRYVDGLPAGQAVATTAGELPARWVIHTVGPVHSVSEDRSELLASCYRESLRLAAGLGARTVAFPAISTGVYRWPAADAARIAIAAVREFEAAGEFLPAGEVPPAGESPAGAPPGSEFPSDRELAADPSCAASLSEVRFVLFDGEMYEIFATALAA